MQMKKQIGVIGGGAAGMMAAITAAKEGAQVTIVSYNQGNIIVNIKESRVAISQEMAHKIMVEGA